MFKTYALYTYSLYGLNVFPSQLNTDMYVSSSTAYTYCFVIIISQYANYTVCTQFTRKEQPFYIVFLSTALTTSKTAI